MKYDLEQTILNIKGEVIEQKYSEDVYDEEGKKSSKLCSIPLTLGVAITDSVLLQRFSEEPLTEEEIKQRYDIYDKVKNTSEELTEEELEFVKKCISRRYDILCAGQFLRMLNK